jgi:hypothetical protein
VIDLPTSEEEGKLVGSCRKGPASSNRFPDDFGIDFAGCVTSGAGWLRLGVVSVRILVGVNLFRLRNARNWCGCGCRWPSSRKTSRS